MPGRDDQPRNVPAQVALNDARPTLAPGPPIGGTGVFVAPDGARAEHHRLMAGRADTPPAPRSLPLRRLQLLRAVRSGEVRAAEGAREARELRAALDAVDPVGAEHVALASRNEVARALLSGGGYDGADPAARDWAVRLQPALAVIAPAIPLSAKGTRFPLTAGGRPPDSELALPAADATAPDRPRLAVGVVVEPPAPAAEHRVVHLSEAGIYLRVKLAQAAFIERLNGSRTLRELTEDGGLPARVVAPLLTKLTEIGLLEGTGPPGSDEPQPRLRVRGPTVQLTLVDPAAALERVRPALRLLQLTWVRAALGLLALAGLVSFAVHLDGSAISTDRVTDPFVLVTLVLAVGITTAVHELGHALAVMAFGGRVRRMGVMLFYLLPAMFCDASDAWRFPYPWQRATVAAAGVVAQLLFASLAALGLWLGLGQELQAWLLLYVLINFSMCVYNLIPFVKLDGYWLLSSLMDRPNLRREAIGGAGAWIRRLLFGTPMSSAERGLSPGFVAFGVACALCGPALLLYSLLAYQDLLLRAGFVGAVVWMVIVLGVLSVPIAALGSSITAQRAQGRTVGVVRGMATMTALVVALCVVVATVPVNADVGGHYERSGGNGLIDATLHDGGRRAVAPGASVILGGRSLPNAIVVAHEGGDRWLVAVDDQAGLLPAAGTATVRASKISIARWAWTARGTPVIDQLGF